MHALELAVPNMPPGNISKETLDEMRAGVAEEHRIAPYAQYTEADAARFLHLDISTVKRMRRSGRIPYVRHGQKSIRYIGRMLCDFILFGKGAVELWGEANSTSEISKSETSGLLNSRDRRPGKSVGLTEKLDTSGALALAQRILNPPK
ncbi:helix-turn-helix domain-containing protein [Methylobacterium sp. Leaf118]|uniref:helix-turn-helix domain-containing protein n=1 Tax=Methylobacterium sp. Leaf118 TaxID=2876562 RepID=UPI001E3D65CA|nr:helix-turn-helix domain-containing protein [Methylobacterium sp. Leaf118]